MNSVSLNWYLLYVKSRQENKVAKGLQQKKIEYFLPHVRSLRQWHDRKKYIEIPLFPGYVFVKINTSMDFFNCQSIDGVCGFVKFGKQPEKVSNLIIDQIKIIVNNGRNVDVSQNNITKGQCLMIENGPLAGLSCEVVQLKGRSKVLVRIDLLNSAIFSDMPVEYLITQSA